MVIRAAPWLGKGARDLTMVKAAEDKNTDVGLLCGIAFNKLRAAVPVYLTENIPVIASAKANPEHKVVLSAFGMNNFIKGLNDNSHDRALAIGVANMQQLIMELRR